MTSRNALSTSSTFYISLFSLLIAPGRRQLFTVTGATGADQPEML